VPSPNLETGIGSFESTHDIARDGRFFEVWLFLKYGDDFSLERPDGKRVEVGLVGKEGFIGLPLVAGFKTASNRAVAQIDGTAFRVDGETLASFLKQCPRLERRLQQYSQIASMQITQIAARIAGR